MFVPSLLFLVVALILVYINFFFVAPSLLFFQFFLILLKLERNIIILTVFDFVDGIHNWKNKQRKERIECKGREKYVSGILLLKYRKKDSSSLSF